MQLKQNRPKNTFPKFNKVTDIIKEEYLIFTKNNEECYMKISHFHINGKHNYIIDLNELVYHPFNSEQKAFHLISTSYIPTVCMFLV